MNDARHSFLPSPDVFLGLVSCVLRLASCVLCLSSGRTTKLQRTCSEDHSSHSSHLTSLSTESSGTIRSKSVISLQFPRPSSLPLLSSSPHHTESSRLRSDFSRVQRSKHPGNNLTAPEEVCLLKFSSHSARLPKGNKKG